MKHVINILVLLIITGLAMGLTAEIIHIGSPSPIGVLYLPLIIFAGLWGLKLYRDY